MEQQKAIAVLQNIFNKYPLGDVEKDAITTAIGVLSWTALSKSRIKARKDKRDKDREW